MLYLNLSAYYDMGREELHFFSPFNKEESHEEGSLTGSEKNNRHPI
jgi:hypothetical protein